MSTEKQGELATCGCGVHGWIVQRTHHLETVDPRFWIEHENDDDWHENRITTYRRPDGGRAFRLEVIS